MIANVPIKDSHDRNEREPPALQEDAVLKDQADGRELFAGFLGVSVQDGTKTKSRGDIAQERAIFDVGDLVGFHVRDVQGKTINVEVRLTDVNEGGNNEEIYEFLKVETAGFGPRQFRGLRCSPPRHASHKRP